MTSQPATPHRASAVALATPSSARKRVGSVLDASYIEEEDATYMVSDSEPESDLSLDDSSVVEDYDLNKSDIALKLVFEDSTPVAIAETPRSDFSDFLVRNEIPRKLFHLVHGFIVLYLYTIGVHTHQAVVPLWLAFAATLLNDIIRLRFPDINKHIVKRMWWVIRDNERELWNGTTFYLAGLALLYTVFPKDICVVSTMLLSWADTAASTFGRLFGKYTPSVAPGKSLAGSLASAFTGLVVCYVFYGYFIPQYAQHNAPGEIFWTPETSRLSIHTYALLAGVIASLSEAAGINGIDDNFTIPVISAVLLTAVVWAFRI